MPVVKEASSPNRGSHDGEEVDSVSIVRVGFCGGFGLGLFEWEIAAGMGLASVVRRTVLEVIVEATLTASEDDSNLVGGGAA